jgi:hypothetical protein
LLSLQDFAFALPAIIVLVLQYAMMFVLDIYLKPLSILLTLFIRTPTVSSTFILILYTTIMLESLKVMVIASILAVVLQGSSLIPMGK